RDVTEQRRAEDVKARFLAMATHEMRTPLAVTSGFASLLLDHWEQTTEADKLQAIGRIDDQARRLGRLVEDLLATSQLDSGELARAQGGEAWYEPNHPTGASFCLRLPLA